MEATTVSTISPHGFKTLVAFRYQCCRYGRHLKWYSSPENQVTVGVRMTDDMTTDNHWPLRILQTQNTGLQADDIDLLGMALMLKIQITVLSSIQTSDMAFKFTANQEMVITHLDLPHKQHHSSTSFIYLSLCSPILQVRGRMSYLDIWCRKGLASLAVFCFCNFSDLLLPSLG